MKYLKTFFTILLFVAAIIKGFGQGEHPVTLFGIDYTSSASLNKSTVHNSFSIYYLRFFKSQKYYAMLDFFGYKFFQQERRGHSYARVSKIGASGGVKCKGGKRANLYLDAGGGFSYDAPVNYANKYVQAGPRAFFLTGQAGARFDIHLHYIRYFFDKESDNQISIGLGFWL